jgi:hypothetical protein
VVVTGRGLAMLERRRRIDSRPGILFEVVSWVKLWNLRSLSDQKRVCNMGPREPGNPRKTLQVAKSTT